MVAGVVADMRAAVVSPVVQWVTHQWAPQLAAAVGVPAALVRAPWLGARATEPDA
jgi:hypothetical protein